MSDLIERLRDFQVSAPTLPSCKACGDAADEIERLQERFDLALRKNGEQWAEIERLQQSLWSRDMDVQAKDVMLKEQQAEIERLRVDLEIDGYAIGHYKDEIERLKNVNNILVDALQEARTEVIRLREKPTECEHEWGTRQGGFREHCRKCGVFRVEEAG